MLVAKLETKERMQDGTSRIVPAGSPFLNPATSELPMINYWAENVPEGSKSYDVALDKIPKKDLKYLVEDEKSPVVTSNEDENKDDVPTPDTNQDVKKEDENDSSNRDSESDSKNDSNKSEQVENSGDENGSGYTKEELEEMSEDVLKEILKDNNISFGHNSKKETLINKILTSL